MIILVDTCLTMSSIMVISALGPVHSVLWLILAFSSAVVLFIFLKVEFIALIFLIVYVGAISILFLFVIMMLNLTDLKGLLDMSNYIPAGFLIGIVCFFEILLFLNLGPDSLKGADYFRWDFIEKFNNIQALGLVLYTDYAYLFLLASFVLLIALMGAMIISYSVEDGLGLLPKGGIIMWAVLIFATFPHPAWFQTSLFMGLLPAIIQYSERQATLIRSLAIKVPREGICV
uniref:NADH-ubiquinone oxidoreductase chain 6 n=1 Tax=Crella elegans TaxID=252961 RepID=A0A0H4K806_CREEL|nr:NADH dehydrogenase subunit 6 [Crella elegans]AKO90223.1 NADH dehydrogenase subunit 6 [Crella elegans]